MGIDTVYAPLRQEDATYHNEFDNGVPVLDVLLDIDLEGSAHHGVDENVLRRVMVWVGLGDGLLLTMIALCTTVRGTNGCHGSCPRVQ